MEGLFEKVTFGQEFKRDEEGIVYIFEEAVTADLVNMSFSQESLRETRRSGSKYQE